VARLITHQFASLSEIACSALTDEIASASSDSQSFLFHAYIPKYVDLYGGRGVSPCIIGLAWQAGKVSRVAG
jgi:hypothetical protein